MALVLCTEIVHVELADEGLEVLELEVLGDDVLLELEWVDDGEPIFLPSAIPPYQMIRGFVIYELKEAFYESVEFALLVDLNGSYRQK